MSHLGEEKLNVDEFKTKITKLEYEFETLRLSNQDNFDQLLQTDNYIEKYLPFKIQNLIGESLTTVIPKIETALNKKSVYDALTEKQ